MRAVPIRDHWSMVSPSRINHCGPNAPLAREPSHTCCHDDGVVSSHRAGRPESGATPRVGKAPTAKQKLGAMEQRVRIPAWCTACWCRACLHESWRVVHAAAGACSAAPCVLAGMRPIHLIEWLAINSDLAALCNLISAEDNCSRVGNIRHDTCSGGEFCGLIFAVLTHVLSLSPWHCSWMRQLSRLRRWQRGWRRTARRGTRFPPLLPILRPAWLLQRLVAACGCATLPLPAVPCVGTGQIHLPQCF